MATVSSRTARLIDGSAGRPRRRVTRIWTTPRALRVLSVATVLTTIAAAAFLTVAGYTSWRAANRVERPTDVMLSASSLYRALSDMDARLAQALLVGGRKDLGVTRQQSTAAYDQLRAEAAQHLQGIASAAGTDTAMQQAVRVILGDLGRYEALAAEALLLSSGPNAPQGQLPAAAIDRHREATDLMHTALLPTVDDLVSVNTWTATRHLWDVIDTQEAALLVSVAIPALLLLLGLQVALALRTRRVFNPALVAATLVLMAAAGAAVAPGLRAHVYLGAEEELEAVDRLRQAQAVSYDARADQWRYLLDPGRATRYEEAFLAKSLDVEWAGVKDTEGFTAARIHEYDAALSRCRTVGVDGVDQGCSGHLRYAQSALRSDYLGERLETHASVDQTLTAYREFQRADREMRALVRDGRRADAIKSSLGAAPNGPNAAFDRYDRALVAAIDVNRAALRRMVAEDERAALRWMEIALGACVLAVALVVVGVRPRIAEYR